MKGAGPTIFCAGQASVDDDGQPLHAGDTRAQAERAFDNLETVLEQAGASLVDVVRINYYTTDVRALFDAWEAVATRLAAAGCPPTSTPTTLLADARAPLAHLSGGRCSGRTTWCGSRCGCGSGIR